MIPSVNKTKTTTTTKDGDKKNKPNHRSSHFILNNAHEIMDIYAVIIFYHQRRIQLEKKEKKRKERPISIKIQQVGPSTKGRNVSNISDRKSPNSYANSYNSSRSFQRSKHSTISSAILSSSVDDTQYPMLFHSVCMLKIYSMALHISRCGISSYQRTIIKLMRHFSHSPSSQTPATEN